MADRKPNSVLFSLKELRRIEDDRVQQEEDDVVKQREDEISAKENAERKAREAEEARIQAEEDRVKAEEQEQDRKQREGELRVQEAERRARVEAEMKLEQSRIAMEIDAREKAKKLPWGTIGTIIGILVVVVAGLGYFSYQKNQEKEATDVKLAKARAAEGKLNKEFQAAQAKFDEEQAALKGKIGDLDSQLVSAKSDAQRDAIRKQIQRERERSHSLAKSRANAKKRQRARIKRIKNRCPPNDPLCGID